MLGQPKTTPMEILLVEDGLTDARMTIFAIRRSGVHHRLTLVRSVADAKMFLARKGVFALAPQINLLLLDVMLPDGTGLDLLRSLRETQEDDNAETIQLPTTVVLTASEDPTLRQQCEQIGAADFMQKPVREEDFMRVVRDHKRLMVMPVS